MQVWLSGGAALESLVWSPHDVNPPRNVWTASLENAPRSAVNAAGGTQSSLHYLADADGATELDRARWPNRGPGDVTIDRPSLLNITTSSALWLQKPSVARAHAKRVVSPSVPLSTTTEFNEWVMGVGGECARFDPPAAWICNPNATGGGANWDGPGPFFPTGLVLGADAAHLFPRIGSWRAADLRQAMLTTWTNGWFTSHFDIDEQMLDNGTTLVFGPRGGVQGGRGWHFDASLPGPIRICTGDVRANDCGPLKIEGILAELDAPNEYWADPDASVLYLFHNATPGTPPPRDGPALVVPVLQQLVTVRGDYDTARGSAAAAPPTRPVANITIRGIGFRDAARTVLEPHGVPSGGDWALQRTAAVFLEGTEGVTLEGCRFKYVGGVALMASGYNRGLVVNTSTFAYIGGSAVAAWGYTSSDDPTVPDGVGIDGTAGNFPRGTRACRGSTFLFSLCFKCSTRFCNHPIACL
jgi:hypothetical protein